ncbi:helix-turn-helix domain-containing protein [Sulfurospirillum sp. MES]|uniref:helix-turn-helix transcriptional regulator n=1 Tax=Sulfurospirillum sp. MES TaxID=1565314 RepID=UPI00257FB70C|nr:helix-turn-helix domain-containing protein [Sulfurospirillum sp. MES]
MQTMISENAAKILEEINSNPMFKKLICLNQKQAAEAIGVSSTTLILWRKDGFGPQYIKVERGKRGRVLYPKIEIAEWLSRTIKTM